MTWLLEKAENWTKGVARKEWKIRYFRGFKG